MLTLLLGALEPLPPKQINGVQKLNPTAQSPIEQIFGGTLKNESNINLMLYMTLEIEI